MYRWTPDAKFPSAVEPPLPPGHSHSAPYLAPEGYNVSYPGERLGTIHPAIAGLVERMNPKGWADTDRQAAHQARREFDIQNTGRDDFSDSYISPQEWSDNPVPISTELESRIEGQPHFPPHIVPNPDAEWAKRPWEEIGHDADLIDQGAPRPLPQHTYVPQYPSYRPPSLVPGSD